MIKFKYILLIVGMLGVTNLLNAKQIDTSKLKDREGALLIEALASSSIDYDPQSCPASQQKGVAIHRAITAYLNAKLTKLELAMKQTKCDLSDVIKDLRWGATAITDKAKVVLDKQAKVVPLKPIQKK